MTANGIMKDAGIDHRFWLRRLQTDPLPTPATPQA